MLLNDKERCQKKGFKNFKVRKNVTENWFTPRVDSKKKTK